MLEHVSLREFDADGKDADREDDPGQFEGNDAFGIGITP